MPESMHDTPQVVTFATHSPTQSLVALLFSYTCILSSCPVALAFRPFSVFTIMHNELEGHRYWYMKNLTNGLGFAALGFGAVLIAGTSSCRNGVQVNIVLS